MHFCPGPDEGKKGAKRYVRIVFHCLASRQRSTLIVPNTTAGMRKLLQERGLRPDGLKCALVARLLVAGVGGTEAQAGYAQGLMRRRRGIVPPGPE